MINLNDNTESLLEDIRSTKHVRDRAIELLFHDQELRRKIKSVVFKLGANEEEFNEVFNIALVRFMKTVIKNKELSINSSIQNYITSIAKYEWIGELKKRNKNFTEELDKQYDLKAEETPEKLIIDFNQKELIHQLLNHLGDKCKSVLMYWANGYKMTEIATLMEYKSDGMAKKKKHLCFKSLLKLLNEKPEIKNLLR